MPRRPTDRRRTRPCCASWAPRRRTCDWLGSPTSRPAPPWPTAWGSRSARFRPDRLDQLLLQPADLTEAALKTFFGFEETTIKPLVDSLLPEPALLTWQKEHLRADWQAQDDAGRTEWDTPVPLIDPDVLGVQDLRTPNPGNPAYDLWKARQDDLAAHAASLDQLRTGQRTQREGFDKIVSTIAPIPELLALSEQRRQGGAVDGQLRALHLPLPAFLHLMRVRELAVAGSVLDSEWADVYAVIVQFRKVGLYPAWRRQEQQKGLILGPDEFALPDPAAAPTPALAAWRATSQGRQAWRRTLEARVPAGADAHPGDPGGGERRRGGRAAGAPGGVPGRDHR